MKQATLFTLLLLLLFACSKKQQPVTAITHVPSQAQPQPKPQTPQAVEEGIGVGPLDSARLCYEQAYTELEAMLEGRQPASFQRAVFLTENAWLENRMSYARFDDRVTAIADFCKFLATTQSDSIDPNLSGYWAIYTYMRDSVRFVIGADTLLLKNLQYDFEDYAGKRDWSSTFVTRLLATDLGTCRSLPYLYKILADKLQLEAYLKLAPNHVYIQHPKTEYINNPYSKGRYKRWYNVELTSGCFPSDGWIAGSAYISLDAIRSGLYMRRLKNNQDINLCLLDLAQGYERKFGIHDPFLDKCIQLALKHDTESAQAKIMQAELLTKRYQQGKRELMPQMEEKYNKLFQEGYAEMPQQMYMQWLYTMRAAGEQGILSDTLYKPFKEENKAYERQLGIPLATMSDGRFKEVPDTSRVRRLGSVMLDTKTGRIVAVLRLDTLYSEASMAPEVLSRWLSTDPVTHPHQSPYTGFDNSPIFLIDPTGTTAGIYLDEDGNQIGDDGIDDGKRYIVNTTASKSEIYPELNQPNSAKSNAAGVADVASITQEEQNQVIAHVKAETEKGRDFSQDEIVKKYFTEIPSVADAEKIDDHLSKAPDNQEFGGVVAIKEDGKTLVLKSIPGEPTPRDGSGGNPEIDLTTYHKLEENKEALYFITAIKFDYHNHPSIIYGNGSYVINGPSRADQNVLINSERVAGINRGGRDKNYYITTNRGVVGKLTRDKFLGK